jgi:serine/threonine protein kinase
VQIEQKAEKIHNKAKDILSTPAKLKFKEIARGKAKVISRIVDQAGDTVKKTAHKVYITATSPGKLAEIHDEYRFNINIKSNCNLTNDDRNYLAIDMTYNAELSRVKQQETFVANTAVGDLESILNKGEDTKDAFGTTSTKLDLKQTSQLASDLLKGSAALHKVGYLHGDLKLDNCLIYKENWAEGRYNLKIADFGIVRQITPDKETFLHTGNARYAAPENKLSKKAEVFSVGLMLIRLFEQPYLDPENNKPTLIPYENDNAPTINKRYGVEKFVVDNPICPQSERKGFFNRIRAGRKFIKAFLYTRFNFSKVSANKQKSEKVIHEYIDALADSMKDTCPNDTRQKLAELLKSMTRSDPRERPTMEQAMKTFSELGLTS